MPVLQFKGKTAIESYHRVVPHHVLDIDRKLSLSKNPGLDGNLIVEGDNLLALKSLLPTHAGRIKCVYIDPPYNTGNEGWVYNDNLTQPQFKEWIGKTVGKEGEDACRHDKWCCMMYPRLALLKELLKDDGVIFISVDDNEAAHLRMLMDEIFGTDRFVAMFAWRNRENPDSRNQSGVSIDHEYVLTYSKAPSVALAGKEKDLSKYQNPDNDPNGPWMSDNLTGLATAKERPNLHYPIVDPKTGRKYLPPPNRGWSRNRESMSALIEKGQIIFPSNPKSRPRYKHFLKDLLSLRTGFSSVLLKPYTTDGTRELIQIFGEKVFVFPKPVDLIKSLVSQVAGPEDFVLDSFAGSGPTAQAVLEMNSNDGGARKWVLVQMTSDTKEEKEQTVNICWQITRERVARVIEGYAYTDAKGKKMKVPGLGGEFTYARVGKRLFDEYRDLGKDRPSYEELARYIWFTETSRPFEPKQLDRKTGKIGEANGESFYLLYDPGEKEARALDAEFLKGLKDKSRRKVVYCEKIWIHRDELAKFGDVRPMLVPFNLK